MNELEEVYRQLAPFLIRYAVGRFDVPSHDAEDIVQEAALSYLQKQDVLAPRAYLVAAVSNGCRSYWRNKLRYAFVPLEDVMLPPMPPPPHVARLTTEAVLRKLSERDRWIVTLRYLHGCKVREIGAALGVSHSRAEKLLRRAVERAKREASTEDVENRGSEGRPLSWTDTYLALEYRSRCGCKEPRWTTTSSNSRRSASSSTIRWRRVSTSISRTSFIPRASSCWTSDAWFRAARM